MDPMHPWSVAARLDGIAHAYERQASLFTGPRRSWRTARAKQLRDRAWVLLDAPDWPSLRRWSESMRVKPAA